MPEGARPSVFDQRSAAVNRRSFGVTRRSFGVNRRSSGVNRRSFGVNQRSFGVNRRSFGVNRRSFGVNRRSFGMNRRSSVWRFRSQVLGNDDVDTSSVSPMKLSNQLRMFMSTDTSALPMEANKDAFLAFPACVQRECTTTIPAPAATAAMVGVNSLAAAEEFSQYDLSVLRLDSECGWRPNCQVCHAGPNCGWCAGGGEVGAAPYCSALTDPDHATCDSVSSCSAAVHDDCAALPDACACVANSKCGWCGRNLEVGSCALKNDHGDGPNSGFCDVWIDDDQQPLSCDDACAVSPQSPPPASPVRSAKRNWQNETGNTKLAKRNWQHETGNTKLATRNWRYEANALLLAVTGDGRTGARLGGGRGGGAPLGTRGGGALRGDLALRGVRGGPPLRLLRLRRRGGQVCARERRGSGGRCCLPHPSGGGHRLHLPQGGVPPLWGPGAHQFGGEEPRVGAGGGAGGGRRALHVRAGRLRPPAVHLRASWRGAGPEPGRAAHRHRPRQRGGGRPAGAGGPRRAPHGGRLC
eukprot:685853-Prorocentrum_minimum.AAC.2